MSHVSILANKMLSGMSSVLKSNEPGLPVFEPCPKPFIPFTPNIVQIPAATHQHHSTVGRQMKEDDSAASIISSDCNVSATLENAIHQPSVRHVTCKDILTNKFFLFTLFLCIISTVCILVASIVIPARLHASAAL